MVDDPHLVANPSQRPELTPGGVEESFRRHKARKGFLVLSKWLRRHVEVVGVEDRSFVCKGSVLAAKAKRISEYIDLYLGGELDRALAAVDAILRDAERLGYKRSLMYFFTPAQEGALPDLLSKRSRIRSDVPTTRRDSKVVRDEAEAQRHRRILKDHLKFKEAHI